MRFFCNSDDDRTLTSCSPVRIYYQTTQRHMPRDGSCTNPTGCCRSVLYMWPSAPLCTRTSSKQFPQLLNIVSTAKDLTWRMTSCRRVSGMWVQAFRSNILSPSPVLDIGNLIKILARLWMSCPKGWTAVRLMSRTVLWISLHPSQGKRTTSFPTNADQTRRSRHPVFGEKFSVLANVFPVQFNGKCGCKVQLQLDVWFYLLTKVNGI